MIWAITTTVLFVGLGIGFFVLRILLAKRKWQRTWVLIESDPRKAKRNFQEISWKLERRIKKSKATGSSARDKLQARCSQAFLGEAICDVRLGQWEAAAKAEGKSREMCELSPDDQARLCDAYLDEVPDSLPPAAVEVLARFLLIADSAGVEGTRQRAREVLGNALELPDDAGPDQIKRVVAIGERILVVAPDLGWVVFVLGCAYLRAKEWKKAVAALKKAVNADPSDAERHAMLGRAGHEAGDRRLARTAFLAAHRLSKTPESACEAANACLASAEEPLTENDGPQMVGRLPLEVAHDLASEATEKSENSVEAWLLRGKIEFRLGRCDDAICSLERAETLSPNHAGVQCLLGRIHLTRGDAAGARRAFNNAQAVAPNSLEIAALAGDLAWEEGDYAKALDAYSQSRLSPMFDPRLIPRLARCHLEQGHPQEAVKLLVEKAEDPALDLSARLTLGRSQARLGREETALETLQKAELSSATAEYRYYFATTLAANRRYDEAEAHLSDLCEDDQWQSRARRQLGHIRTLKGDYEAAESYYRGQNGEHDSHWDLGRLNLLLGEPATAREEFQKALDEATSPRNMDVAQFGRAVAMALLGEPDPITEFLERDDFSPWTYEVLGNIAYDDRRNIEAMDFYEKAIRKRARVSSYLLVRLAIGYLQLRRYRDALPHLVELERRRPGVESIRFNLALCRYHIGRSHFRKRRWDMARGEWHRAAKILDQLGAEPAEGVRNCEFEAAYRVASDILTSEYTSEVARSVKLLDQGCRHSPQSVRWWFGAGLGHAKSNDYGRSAECFAEAVRLDPHRSSFALGLGLSLEAAGQTAKAREAFQNVLKVVTKDAIPPRHELFSVAGRFALAMSYAKEKQWSEAGRELEPLLGHPLIQSSKRISDVDVAQAIVAYWGLGGLKDEASRIARKYLKDTPGFGDVLTGVMQVESGDYEGGAKTLATAYEHEKKPSVLRVLVACLLAAAAKRILDGDIDGAVPFVNRVLHYENDNHPARQLRQAITLARHLKNLDADQIDTAIEQCKRVLKSDQSAQLVRTLGILYHRKSMENERKNKATESGWKSCLNFWRKNVFQNNKFWTNFEEEYNLGKGKRERVKKEDIEAWKAELPSNFASIHASIAGVCLKKRAKGAAKLHLDLIWEWSPDFEPPEDFLSSAMGELDDLMAGVLTSVLKNVKNQRAKKALGTPVGWYWANEALKHHNASQNHVNSVNVLIEAANQFGQAGILAVKANVIAEARKARNEAEKARDLFKKARNVAPHEPKFKELCDVAEDAYRSRRSECSQLGI